MCVQCIHSSFISHSFIHSFTHTVIRASIHTFKHSYIHYQITHTNRHSSIPINPNWYQFDFNHDWYQFDINYRSIIFIVTKNNYTLHITLPSHYYYNRQAVNPIINVGYLLYHTMHTYVIHTGLPELRRQYQQASITALGWSFAMTIPSWNNSKPSDLARLSQVWETRIRHSSREPHEILTEIIL